MDKAKTRSLRLKLDGPAVTDGRVSVRLLTNALDSFQRALLDLGQAKLARAPSTPGRKPSGLAMECELFLARVEAGSFAATLELREPERGLFPDLRPFAEQSLSQLGEAVERIARQDLAGIQDVIPDADHRAKFLQDLLPAVPSAEEDDYTLSLAYDGGREFQVTKPPRDWVEQAGGTPTAQKVSAEAGEAWIQGRAYIERGPEGDVRVRGPVTLTQYSLFDQDDLRPYRPKRIEHEDRTYDLTQPLDCEVTVEDGLIVITCPSLRIRAYAGTREGAEAEFAEEFVFLVDEFAASAEDELTGNARELRERLKSIIEGEPAY